MNELKNEINEKEKIESDDLVNSNIKQHNLDITETVVSILVNKIISDAVINSKVNHIYKGMSDHCFSYLTNFINPYLETRFLFYENDIEDPSYQKNQIYFSRKPLEKLNTWNLIPEPKTNEKDRYANSNTKIVRYKNKTDMEEGVKESTFALDAEEDIKYIDHHNNVFNESIDLQDEKTKDKDKTHDKTIKENKIKEINKSLNNNTDIKKQNQLLNSMNNLENKKNAEKKKIKVSQKRAKMDKYLEDLAPKKKEKEEILEISITDDLPKEAYENTYSIINSNDENTRLRREREIEIEQKNAARLAEIEREKRAKQKLYRRNVKDFDSNRLTFDSNGKIINLRTINENLMGEFMSSRIKVKSEKNKKKNTLELKDVVYPIQRVDLNTIKEGKNESVATTRRASINKEIINTVDSDISKIKVEKNFEIKAPSDNNFNKKNKDKDKISIIPSGYNFDKFIPEVGVIITGEDERDKKEGGFEYVKKYNKPSFNSNSINNISSLMNSNNDLNNKNIKTDENNYIGYKEEFNENNPLMQNVHSMNNNNLKYSSPNLKKLHSLKIYNSNYNIKNRHLINSYDKINTDINQYQSIQLSKNFEENNLHLKNIFAEPESNNFNKNNLKSIDAYNLQKMNYYEKAVLPFKNFMNKKKRKKLKLINKEIEKQQKKNSDEALINKFNVKIINNKEWGKSEEDPAKIQQKLREEMENENKPKSNLRLPRINYNRMKNYGMQVMTEGNNIRERKLPLFGGNLK